MKTKIAIIYEGVKSEKDIFQNLEKNFFSANQELTIIGFPADGNIYMLWERLKEDDFETDVISVVKEMCKTCQDETIMSMQASEFSEIYLFFDFDIHNNNLKKEHRNTDVLKEMFDVFDNETEFGKLYVSYPMVEAIKAISLEKGEYSQLYITLDESAEYKMLVSAEQDFANYSKLTRDMWLVACEASRKRAGIIVEYKYISDYIEFISKITQKNIYKIQKELYVKDNGCIAILNSIPLFLIEYFKIEFWQEILSWNVVETSE